MASKFASGLVLIVLNFTAPVASSFADGGCVVVSIKKDTEGGAEGEILFLGVVKFG